MGNQTLTFNSSDFDIVVAATMPNLFYEGYEGFTDPLTSSPLKVGVRPRVGVKWRNWTAEEFNIGYFKIIDTPQRITSTSQNFGTAEVSLNDIDNANIIQY